MGRPRTVTDDDLLAATERALARAGPLRLTLDDVATEAGVTAPALVKRFGSKRALLLAVAARGEAHVDAAFDAARERHEAPLKALVEAFVCLASFATSPAALAHGLAFLEVDLTDPEFQALASKQMARLRERARELLDEALRAEDLSPQVKTRAVAQALEVAYHGSLVAWGLTPTGRATDVMQRNIDAVLKPLRSR